MKINLTYGSSYDIVITTKTGDVFRYEIHNAPLQNAVDFAELIFDANTGEILAECTPDPDYEESDFENENYDSDWGYNEDMGFDPYMGCYTDDC